MQQNTLQKKIGFWSATSIIIGSIIGSGVFMKPATMAAQLGSPVWLTIVWIIGGVFSLFGAMIYAELGALMPETGGIYTYFRKMFGDFFAYLYGWASFSVINTAAVAAISFVCAQYADFFLHLPRFDPVTEQQFQLHLPFIGDFYPLKDAGVKALTLLIVLVLTILNYRTVRGSNLFQVISTLAKVAVIGALIAGIFMSGNGSTGNFFSQGTTEPPNGLLMGIVVAMTGAFMAYDGWINITYVAGEVKRPQRNIPRSLILGVVVCISIYVAINLAYLYALPIDSMASSSLVAADAIAQTSGRTGAAIIAALIVVCTLGSTNGNIMATCRVTYAMGKDKIFAAWSGKTHPRFHTPGNALWLHTAWTSLFIITGSFDMLADMFIFITWIAYMFGAMGIFIFRKKFPEMERPYRVWGYPFVPILFIAFTAFYLVMTVWSDVTNYLNHRQPVINSVLGLFITALGIPLYFYFRSKNRTREDEWSVTQTIS
jgi:APA family basic amino acid/polyamine antiporter